MIAPEMLGYMIKRRKWRRIPRSHLIHSLSLPTNPNLSSVSSSSSSSCIKELGVSEESIYRNNYPSHLSQRTWSFGSRIPLLKTQPQTWWCRCCCKALCSCQGHSHFVLPSIICFLTPPLPSALLVGYSQRLQNPKNPLNVLDRCRYTQRAGMWKLREHKAPRSFCYG